jgi:outer membrane lipoprotein SlyB
MAASVREAVGLFHDERSLERAIDDLLALGFDRVEISLLASHEAVERKLGHRYERSAELEDDSRVPRLAYVDIDSRTEGKASMIGGLAYIGAIAASGLVVASGGTLALAVAAAAIAGGGGGMMGAYLSRLMGSKHAKQLQQHLDEGGLLLWVEVADAKRESLAVEALQRHSADDVHVHELPASQHAFKGGVSRKLSFMEQLGL